MRYKLKGKYMWCLNPKNGWIRIGKVIFRWNDTVDKKFKTLFSIEVM